MFGWIMYIIAILIYAVDPVSNIWMIAFVFGMLLHIKWWVIGTVAFLVGFGWKRPF